MPKRGSPEPAWEEVRAKLQGDVQKALKKGENDHANFLRRMIRRGDWGHRHPFLSPIFTWIGVVLILILVGFVTTLPSGLVALFTGEYHPACSVLRDVGCD